MDKQDDELVVAVQELSVIRGRSDAVHSDAYLTQQVTRRGQTLPVGGQ